MSSTPKLLADIWEAYELSMESFKITMRGISGGDGSLLRNTQFSGKSPAQADKLLQRSAEHIKDFYVVFLWAVFERHVIQYLKGKGAKIKETDPAKLAIKLYAKYENDVEYGRFTDTLDLLKEIIDPNTIGNAKQIKEYRDWVVHRNKKPASNIHPKMALDLLSAIITELDKN